MMVRMEAIAEASFAVMRARTRFGTAIAAMIKMIATTISNSISEKPLCLCRRISSKLPQSRQNERSVDGGTAPCLNKHLPFRFRFFLNSHIINGLQKWYGFSLTFCVIENDTYR